MKEMKIKLGVLIVTIIISVTSVGIADVRPAGLFTDNMVIQRETRAAVWGLADADERVTVTGSWGESATTTADGNGKWKVKLQTPKAGGPYTITLKGKNTIKLENVLSGDVWLCSGQSNMQWPVSKTDNPAEEAANANYPQIRHFMVERNAALEVADECKGAWKICSPDTVGSFSATAYFTGRELHKHLNIPIGLLTSSWGGTCIEAWTPFAEQMDDQFALQRKAALDAKAKNYSPEKARASYEHQLKNWEKRYEEAKARKKQAPRRPRLQTDPRLNQNYPGNLYNGMIHPLLSFAIKGVVWYQGEANAKDLASAEYYRVQLDRMVGSWRRKWGQNFPFYAVQLPNFKEPQVHPVESENIWPAIRESFVYVAQNTPWVATSSMIDIGEANNIHPKNKQDVGRRMASTILSKTYEKDTPTTPFMKAFAVEDDKIVITFEYTGSGLVARGDKLKGFAIAGADKQFVWADARIEHRNGRDCVVISSKAVANPVAVRYAWADNPAGCNLYSREGFPASPFRTDSDDM
jgi:sialate O-acetylesterase